MIIRAWIYIVISFLLLTSTTVYSCHEYDQYPIEQYFNENNCVEKGQVFDTDPEIFSFIQNNGQINNNELLFYSETDSINVYFFSSAIVLNYDNNPMNSVSFGDQVGILSQFNIQNSTNNIIDSFDGHPFISLSFPNSSTCIPKGVHQTEMISNYYLGKSPSGWYEQVPSFYKVFYYDLYPGIDLCFYFLKNELKYDFILRPWAQFYDIEICVNGHESIGMENNYIKIKTRKSTIYDRNISAFYKDNPETQISCRYEIVDHSHYKFVLGDHDQSRVVVIDPIISSTYFGGSHLDFNPFVATDEGGNIILTGMTTSHDFPNESGNSKEYQGRADGFISKLSPDGKHLIWSSYFGGEFRDAGYGLAIDSHGDIYIAGGTKSQDFPITPGVFQDSIGGDEDLTLCKFNGTSGRLLFSTYLGGSNYEQVKDIILQKNGTIFLCGFTESNNYNTTSGVLQETYRGNGDGFISVLSSDGSLLLHSTYLGRFEGDECSGIAVDDDGTVYTTGWTANSDFPVTEGSYQTEHAGSFTDAFVCEMTSDLSTIIRSTFIGGGAGTKDYGKEIAIGNNGNIIIMGVTDDFQFPTTSGSFQPDYGGEHNDPYSDDVFVTQLTKDLKKIVFSTFLGGKGTETAGQFDIDHLGNIYITGETRSQDFPTTDGALKTDVEISEAFVCRISRDGSYLNYSTLLGGSKVDVGISIEEIQAGYVVVSGYTNSSDFPTVEGAYQRTISGEFDVFLTTLGTDVFPPIAYAGSDQFIDQFDLVYFNSNGSSDDIAIANFSWTFEYTGDIVDLYGRTPSFRFDEPGIYLVSLNVTDGAGNWATDTLTVTVRDIERPHADAGEDITIAQHEMVRFNGSGSSDLIGIVNLTWHFYYNDTHIFLFGSSPTFVFHTAGEYSVVLNVSDEAGNWAMDDVNVTVLDITPPVARAGQDITIDEGKWVPFNGLGSTDNVEIVNWTWRLEYNGSIKELYGITVKHRFDIVGEYKIMLTVRDAAGLTSHDDLNVTVLDISPPHANAGDDVTIDQNSRMRFDGTRSHDNIGIMNWTWSFRNETGTIELFGPSPEFVFREPGLITVTLTVSDAAENRNSDIILVHVIDIEPPIARVNLPIIIDQNSYAELNGTSSTDNSGISNWTWEIIIGNETVILYESTARFFISDAGRHLARLTVTDAALNEGQYDFVIIVNDTEPPIIVIEGPTVEEEGSKVRIDASDSHDNTGISDWIWRFEYDDKEIVRHGERLVFTFEVPGEYLISIQVIDNNGNDAFDTHNIKINESKYFETNNLSYIILMISIISVISIVAVYLFLSKRRSEQ